MNVRPNLPHGVADYQYDQRRERKCLCGCGRVIPVFTKKSFWGPACRKRLSKRVSDLKKSA